MSESLNIYSLNCRGLRDKYKRQAVFLWLKSRGSGIYFLQETHSNSACEQEWNSEWDGKIVYSHGLSNCRGVAFLISSDIDNLYQLLILKLTVLEDMF